MLKNDIIVFRAKNVGHNNSLLMQWQSAAKRLPH